MIGLVVALALVPAQEPELPPLKERVDPAPPHTWLALRGGLANNANAATLVQVCGEIAPLAATIDVNGTAWHTGLAIEGCGNGSSFLFPTAVPELAHFRAKWQLWGFDTALGWFTPFATAGFAELQTIGDTPGFSFFSPSPGRVSTAGPEVGAAMRYTYALPYGFELIAEAGIAVAYVPYAPQLVVPSDPFQTSLTLTAGVGW
jgi:hypothetical protein